VCLYLLCFVLFVLCFLYCFVYVCVFLLALSVLPPSDKSIDVSNNNNNNNNNPGTLKRRVVHKSTKTYTQNAD
jgi:hypothetical protein